MLFRIFKMFAGSGFLTALPQTPLGELTALPQPPSWFKGYLLISRRVREGEEKGREGKKRREKGKG